MANTTSPLERFSASTRSWFETSFAQPTAAQLGAWQGISSGNNVLVVAPTGSGKTLAAFLWALDRLAFGSYTACSQRTGAEGAQPPRTGSDNPASRAAELTGSTQQDQGVTVLYVSPLKALASDVERNLASPLIGIGHAADRLNLTMPDIKVGTRTGDTPAAERRAFPKNPPDILITTPESLFLLLTSKAREALRTVQTVIVDEIHTMVGTKRGAHLGLTLERLDELTVRPTQRVGLSATVNPAETVAAFLSGSRPREDGGRATTIVRPPSTKEWDLSVVVPLEDMTDLGKPTDDLTGQAAGDQPRASIWPYIEHDVLQRIDPRTHPGASTLVFSNARRTAERITARLNEAWAAELEAEPGEEADESAANDFVPVGRPAQEIRGAGATTSGAPPELARAHHGSVSKEQRSIIEEALKAGHLPAVVSTSSLELGIDMGAIDQVLQLSPPPSVAAGLQRVGRAGHQVGAVSKGVIYPKHRSELLPAALITQSMLAGEIEPLHSLANPLDVLAQQIVAMSALDDWDVDALLAVVRRCANFVDLPRSVFEATLDMLAGRYPSTEFAELRPRVVWDRGTNTVSGRPAAQRLAVTSGGTIPDRGLFGVFLAGGEGPGRRVGELDEEMVYESRVGDAFTLGSSTWRIEDITHDQVLVTPAPGQPGRLPFWRGDELGRPAALGKKLGALYRQIEDAPGGVTGDETRELLVNAALDNNAVGNAVTYLDEMREAVGYLPTDKRLIIERFRDELGDWRIVLHSPFGLSVHSPWALVVSRVLSERFGVDVQAMPHDDGIVLRLPDMVLAEELGSADLSFFGGDDEFSERGFDEFGEPVTPASPAAGSSTPSGAAVEPVAADAASDILDEVTTALLADPDDIERAVTESVTGSALFASRFRECAARALLLPRRNPTKRQPLWQQRQRASQLLDVASKYPTFPIMLETARECTRDVFDLDALIAVLRDIRAGTITVVSTTTGQASPFASSIMFGYVAQFLYEGDSPAAERRAAALALDPELLADLLGRSDGTTLADLLDADAVRETHNELQRLTEQRRVTSEEGVTDLLRALGPLTADAVALRCADPSAAAEWLAALARSGRIMEVPIAAQLRYAIVEDAGLLRDALGVPLPPGLPDAFKAPTKDPWSQLLGRFARTRAPFTAEHAAATFGVGIAVIRDVMRRMSERGLIVVGDLLPAALAGELLGNGAATDEQVPYFADAEVMRRLRRRSLAALRAEVEPVAQNAFAGFLPSWSHIAAGRGGLRGADGLLQAVESLVGARVPISALESLILPARVRDYRPSMLDELCTAGEVTWVAEGPLGTSDGWMSLHLPETLPLTRPLPPLDRELSSLALDITRILARGGGFYFKDILAELRSAHGFTGSIAEATDALWDVVWAGGACGDTIAPLRAVTAGGGAHKAKATPNRRAYRRPSRSGLRGLGAARRGAAPQLSSESYPGRVQGRWSLVPEPQDDATLRAHAAAEVLLDRYGVVTRGSVMTENIPGGFAAVYKVFAAKEDAGQLRRGYFVEGLGASQFATAGAVDRLRAEDPAPFIVLAATDPANPYGAALDWPTPTGPGVSDTSRHTPARRGGALVCLAHGELVAYIERGAKTLLPFTDNLEHLGSSASAIAGLVSAGRLATVTIHTVGDSNVLSDAQGVQHVRTAFVDAGFHLTTRGLRMRRA